MTIKEILIYKGWLSEAQLAEADEYRQRHGGRIEDHLLRFGYITNKHLLQALSEKYEGRITDLSSTLPEPEALSSLPAETAWNKNVLPFKVDDGGNLLHVACTDPDDMALEYELCNVAKTSKIKLYAAPSSAINCALLTNYRRDFVSTEIPSDTDPKPASSEIPLATTISGKTEVKGKVLLVCPGGEVDQMAGLILRRDGFETTVVVSLAAALALIDRTQFHALFINGDKGDDYTELLNRFRKSSSGGMVRFYKTLSDLLFNESTAEVATDLLEKNMRLMATLLSSRDKQASHHAAKVGGYVDQVCRNMNLNAYDRLLITNAAYLHDFARIYVGDFDEPFCKRSIINLSATRLESLNHASELTAILRFMYQELDESSQNNLSLELFGGNVVTVVDFVCENRLDSDRLTPSEFDVIKQNLQDQTGILFLEEVVDCFLEILRLEVVVLSGQSTFCRVLILDTDSENNLPLESCLQNLGFETIRTQSMDRSIELYSFNRPDALVLIMPGEADHVTGLVGRIIANGIAVDQLPTFLLTDRNEIALLTSLLHNGIEDILPIDDLDPLLVKLTRVRNRLEEETSQRVKVLQDMGTHGSLYDMNLIDLLQAMGTGNRTVRISVTAYGQQMTIYLQCGNIIFAECEDVKGVDAVYRGVSWENGIWSVDPVAVGKLPVPNIHASNDSILLEACRLLDEKNRDEESRNEKATDDIFPEL